jgi:exopolysaccharide biosynthesis protein
MQNAKCKMQNGCIASRYYYIIKKFLPSFLIFNFSFFIFFSGLADASTLYRVRFGHYPDKIRAVFDFNGAFTYQTDKSKPASRQAGEKIIIHLKKTTAGPDIQNYVELNDLAVRYFEIQKEGEDLKVTVPLAEPVDYNIFPLNTPPRLVIDFGREFLSIVSDGSISDGIEFLKVRKGSSAGSINASVMKIDLKKAEVRPALAKKPSSNIFNSFFSLFTPWVKKQARQKNFVLDKVSSIVAANNAVAGINGTYFAYTGRPLGALMIDQNLISFPIYDRTAFFLDENMKPYIDNITLSSRFKVSGTSYKITGINQSRRKNDIIMYTPIWGEHTETNSRGIEIVVSKSVVSKINVSNSEIPDDGYVLSVSGPGVEALSENVKIGDKIDAHIRVIPYTTSPQSILHLISGGPRLLKHGRTYVSKHEEKFKRDIARGRAARSAAGITKQGELLLVTVDGLLRKKGKEKHKKESIGATLEELSNLMLSLGAVEAMNLDGGSSSTMVINGRTVNNPTSGHQRRVSNAIVVRSKINP